jgi:hypothetical protein
MRAIPARFPVIFAELTAHGLFILQRSNYLVWLDVERRPPGSCRVACQKY